MVYIRLFPIVSIPPFFLHKSFVLKKAYNPHSTYTVAMSPVFFWTGLPRDRSRVRPIARPPPGAITRPRASSTFRRLFDHHPSPRLPPPRASATVPDAEPPAAQLPPSPATTSDDQQRCAASPRRPHYLSPPDQAVAASNLSVVTPPPPTRPPPSSLPRLQRHRRFLAAAPRHRPSPVRPPPSPPTHPPRNLHSR